MFRTFIKPMLHFYWRFTRPMTLGVRAIVQEGDGRIILVRHTYVKGWHLPGGGVDPGETIEQSIAKELMEEANVRVLDRPQLLSFHKNLQASKRDHVALFHVTSFEASELPEANREIAECRWFPIDELPEGTTTATRKRIEEFLGPEDYSEYW